MKKNAEPVQTWSQCLEDVARHRDREQFRKLFDHFAPLIKAFAYKLSDVNQADMFAEELVQETMIKVWTKARTFDARKSSASTWIFTIARNTRIDLLRKYARINNGGPVSEDEDEVDLYADDIWARERDTDLADSIDREKQSEMIHESINKLPDDQMNVIRTIYLDGKSHSEAAKILNLPLGTIKSRVRLALQKLKLAIDT